jgi:hypothetical protein
MLVQVVEHIAPGSSERVFDSEVLPGEPSRWLGECIAATSNHARFALQMPWYFQDIQIAEETYVHITLGE